MNQHPPFACPSCRAPLLDTLSQDLRCICGRRYSVHDGIPEFVSSDFLDEFKEIERRFHDESSASMNRGSIIGRNSEFHRHFKAPMMNLPKGSSILEVACGTRADGIEIALAGQLVTSLDISSKAVVQSRELSRKNSVNDRMRFLVADAEHLPFQNGAFDSCFAAASFHHFPNQDAALAEMKRVTKTGGYVILGVEPAAWPYRTIYHVLQPVKRFIRRRRPRPTDSIADDSTNGYTKQSLRDLFSRTGLRIIELRQVKGMSELYDSGTRLIGRLLKRNFQTIPSIDHLLARLDAFLDRIPGVQRLYWHWNVISVVP